MEFPELFLDLVKRFHGTVPGVKLFPPSSKGQFGQTLASVGDGGNTMLFTEQGVFFTAANGQRAQYSWLSLGVILPQDLSLGTDKLRAYRDIEPIVDAATSNVAKRLAQGVFFTFAAYIGYSIFDLVTSALHWLSALPPLLGIVVLIVAVVVTIASSAVLVPILAGTAVMAAASGGVLAFAANLAGHALRPVVRFVMTKRHPPVPNALRIVNQVWIKDFWGVSTEKALDLIVIGLKVYRRLKQQPKAAATPPVAAPATRRILSVSWRAPLGATIH